MVPLEMRKNITLKLSHEKDQCLEEKIAIMPFKSKTSNIESCKELAKQRRLTILSCYIVNPFSVTPPANNSHHLHAIFRHKALVKEGKGSGIGCRCAFNVASVNKLCCTCPFCLEVFDLAIWETE